MIHEFEKLKTIDELAADLSRSRAYVSAMKRAGFPMPGGTATVNEARDWLRDNPEFRAGKAWKVTKMKPTRSPRVRSV